MDCGYPGFTAGPAGERVWVDHPECKLFVDNILTGTVIHLAENRREIRSVNLIMFLSQPCD
jgi:hypothetical protein